MPRGLSKRPLTASALSFALLALCLGLFLPAPARSRDPLAAARQAYAKAATPAERQSAALSLGVLLLRRATTQTDPVPAELTEAETLFHEAVAAGGSGADQGEAGLLAALLARGPDHDSQVSSEIDRLRESSRNADLVLCIAMNDLLPASSSWKANLPASDKLNDRIHALFPAAPYLVSSRISKPEKLSTPNPTYAEEDRKNRLRGTVVVQSLIDRDGHLADLLVLQRAPGGLTDSAVSNLRRWTFHPALLNGSPVPVCYWLTTTFDVH
ncbi:MAG: energy transducer TonB [Acidobacteriota bacterium]|nr:energy transducer TonB [Acidobacteriota bacterium]